jgi:hypothetical protein
MQQSMFICWRHQLSGRTTPDVCRRLQRLLGLGERLDMPHYCGLQLCHPMPDVQQQVFNGRNKLHEWPDQVVRSGLQRLLRLGRQFSMFHGQLLFEQLVFRLQQHLHER